jgi:hypothetical protein
MLEVVAELAQRYAHHASFGGVGVHLSADSFILLPDESYSLDEATFERFLRDTGLAAPAQPSRPAERAAFVHRSGEKAWLTWRAEQVAGLVRQMREEVTQRRPGSKLVLTTSHLLSGHLAAAALRPTMPPRDAMRDLLWQLGLDLALVDDPAIVVPRPQRLEPTFAGVVYPQSRHWNLDGRLDQLFRRSSPGAALNFLAPAPQRLADFDAQSPLGAGKSRTVLISQLTPSDAAQRERFAQSLATADVPLLIDGGWMLPLGQEEALHPWVQVFRRLPAEPFVTVKREGQPQELIVRTLARGMRNWFYVLNPTPWPLKAEVLFRSRGNLQLVPASQTHTFAWESRDGQWVFSAPLEPFGLWGGEILGGDATIAGWSVQLPEEVGPSLGQQVRELTRRAHQIKAQPRPLALANAQFDQAAAEGLPSDWQTARGVGLSATVEPRGGLSTPSCLHLVRRGGQIPLWVRSSPVAVPATGRLQMVAALRVADAQSQPQLRLAVEGRWQGQVYYRRINVGRPERPEDPTPPELTPQWTRFAISVPDLPLSGLSDLRVGFDLMSDGEVWIDDVTLLDLWLEEREYDELLKSASAARLQVETGRLYECHLFLESYWPALLRRHVLLEEPPATAALPPTPPQARRLLPAISARGRTAGPLPAEGSQARPRGAAHTAEADKSWLPSWLRWR